MSIRSIGKEGSGVGIGSTFGAVVGSAALESVGVGSGVGELLSGKLHALRDVSKRIQNRVKDFWDISAPEIRNIG